MTTWKAQGKHPGIYQDASDKKHWRVVVNMGRVAKGAARERKTPTLHGNLSDALAVRAKLLGDKHEGRLRPQGGKAPKTVGEWVPLWLATYKQRKVEASTYERYQNQWKLYVKPFDIAGCHLPRVTADDVQKWYNDLQDTGLAPGTQFQAVAMLRQAMKRAVASGLITRNPMDDTEAPTRPGRRQFRVPSDDELTKLLDMMREADAAVYPLVRMALATGMREGELIALEWSNVDLDAGMVHVCRSAARVPAGPEGRRYYEYEFKSTKTGDERDVPLDAPTVAWLKDWRKTVAETKMLLRPRRWTETDGDLVFPALSCFAGSPAGRAWQNGTIRKAFGRYTSKVGLGYLRFHDLRHIFGARLHRNGAQLLTISRLMGHRSIATTANCYGHVGEAQQREAVEAVSGLWGASS
jgi:integrase